MTIPPPDDADLVRVVVVDDSETVRAMLRALLDAVQQTDVVGEACNGAEGVDVVLHHRPDVVIMDIQMPIQDGLEAAKAIRERWPDARIIVNSAYSDKALIDEAERVGVTSFVTKDLRPRKLVAEVLRVAAEDPT